MDNIIAILAIIAYGSLSVSLALYLGLRVGGKLERLAALNLFRTMREKIQNLSSEEIARTPGRKAYENVLDLIDDAEKRL